MNDDVSDRFGSFEEFKKHNIGPDGTLSAHKKFLCGLGLQIWTYCSDSLSSNTHDYTQTVRS